MLITNFAVRCKNGPKPELKGHSKAPEPHSKHHRMKEQESYISAVKTFNRFLEQKRLRKTPERFAILKKAWQIGQHFGVEELHSALESDSYHVSRATVYNTIDILVQSGVLTRHQFGSGESRYEPAKGNHIHLICTRCGKIQEVDDKGDHLPELLNGKRYSSFEPAYWSACIYGVCGACSRKMRRKTKAIEAKND